MGIPWGFFRSTMLLGAGLLAVGCTSEPNRGSVGPELAVAAASDLQLAFGEIAGRFEDQSGCRVHLTFGSTGLLSQQIEQGAPFDLFAAANVSYIDRLAKKGRIVSGTRQLYARGRIVLAANRHLGIELRRLEDLMQSGIKHVAIANPGHAPYGLAAKEALQSAGLWDSIQPKLVLGENVRQALQYVQTGNAEAGIVALSVADVAEVRHTLVDSALHAPLDQALAVIAGTRNESLAREFAAYILSQQARPILSKYGFEHSSATEPAGNQAR